MARIIFELVRLDKVQLVTFLDASFGKEEGCRSQSGMITLLTDDRVATQRTPACVVEFHSVRIPRIVKSTLAAESASLSTALDRQLYARLLLEALLHGEPDCSAGLAQQTQDTGHLSD